MSKQFVIKFANETLEDAIIAGTFSRRSEVEKEARFLIVEGYAPSDFEIVEVKNENQ